MREESASRDRHWRLTLRLLSSTTAAKTQSSPFAWPKTLRPPTPTFWIDQLDIAPGQEWDNGIEDAREQLARRNCLQMASERRAKTDELYHGALVRPR